MTAAAHINVRLRKAEPHSAVRFRIASYSGAACKGFLWSDETWYPGNNDNATLAISSAGDIVERSYPVGMYRSPRSSALQPAVCGWLCGSRTPTKKVDFACYVSDDWGTSQGGIDAVGYSPNAMGQRLSRYDRR